ncbi:S-layer homology domain-containing protein [Saccharibacillus sacchari]|uniref:S-layer homology domain-containing protein n=1 Tax=Saccharibacillus sacchari TaxID=456493 RepID=A0ACC6PHA8_9BACL
MQKGAQKRGWKSWFSGLMAIVLLIAMFPLAPEKAKAAGTLTVTSSVPGAVAGDTTDISLTYSNSAVLTLNLGALDYILPAGIKATTDDQINGVNLTPSQILDNGQRVRLSGLSLSLLQANTTLLLKQKTIPNSGTYNFEAKVYGVTLTVINTNPSESLSGSLLVSPLTLPLASITTTNNSGDNDTIAFSGVKAQDIVKIYNTNGTLRTTLTASEDGTLSVPLTLTPSGGSVSVSLTRGGVESAKVQVSYLAEIVPPILVNSIYVSNQPGNADSVTVTNLTPGDTVRLYSTLAGGTAFATSSAVASGQTSVVIPTTLTRLGGTLYASRVRSGLESVRTPVVYLPEVLAALTADVVTITNGSGNADTVRVTGLTQGDIVYVYASDETLLDTFTANSSGVAQGTIALKPGGGNVNVVLERDGIRSAALPVAYVAETVRSLLATEVTITNNPNDSDFIRVTALENGDRIVVKVGAEDPFTSAPVTNGEIDIPVTLLPGGGSVTVGILRNTIEGPKLTLIYDAERVEAPTSAQITTVNNSGSADTVTVSGLLAGDTVVVYGSANGTTELGREAVGNNGIPTSATVGVTLTPDGGTAYVAIQRHGVLSARTAATYSAETVPAPLPGAITVTNGSFSTDTVRVTGLQSGDTVRVYQANGTTLLGTTTAVESGGNFVASLTNQTLTPTGGSLQVSIVRNTVESPKTTVSYNAEYVAPPAPAAIRVTNNASPAADTVSVTGLNAGDSIRVYRTGETTASFSAVNGIASGTLTLLANGGTLSVSILRNGVESTATPVAYPAEIPNFVGSISVINAEGDEDSFNLSGMVPLTTVEVFSQSQGTGTETWTGTVASDGTVSIPVTLAPGGGTLSFRFTPPLGGVSATIDVAYGREPVTPPAAASITVTNNSGNDDNVTVSDIRVGDLVTISGVDGNGALTTIGSGTVTGPSGTDEISVDVTLAPAGGTIAVGLTRGGLTSAETLVNYASEVVNAPSVADIQVANGSGTGTDSVTVGSLQIGDVITVTSYAADDTEVDSDTATASGTTATADVQLSPLGGYVTVTITRNTIVSAATRANYNAETIAAPLPAAITVTNAPGTSQDRVEVSGLVGGDYVTVVTYDASNVEVDRDTVAAQGTTATANVELAPAGGYAAVTIIRYSVGGIGGVASAATRVAYNAELVPPPAAEDITITNNSGDGDTVVVRGLQTGDEIRVYNEDGSEYLGPGTASNGTATANVKLLPSGGTVWVMIFRNTLQSQGTQKPYASEVVAAPAVADVTVVNAAGPSDTVTVSGLQAGDEATVTTEANVSQSGTVATGATSVTIPVTLAPGGGIVQVTIKRNTINSPATGVPYAAEVIPAPALSNISVSNVSNTGGIVDTVTVSGVTAGDIVHVYDSSYVQIGSGTSAGASVTVTIPDNLEAEGGSLFVTLERDGLMSDYVAVIYGAETVEPIDTALVSADNAVGNSDTLTVGGLNAGETLRVYRANGSELTVQLSVSNPNVYETTFAAGGETLTLVRVRGGIESVGVSFAVGAELVPSVDEGSITVVNNTGNQDTVTVDVAAADYETGDTYIVYDESMNSLGRSSVYANGAFTISVTLLPTGGTVQVALERRTVVGPATSVTYTAEAAEPNAGPPASDITVTNGLGDNDPVVVDNVTAGDIVVVYGAGGVELGRATANADGSLTVRVDLADGSGGTIEVSIIRDGNESIRTPKTYAAYDAALPPVPQEAQVTIVRSSDPNEEDVVTVTGLVQNDEVEFYDDEDTQIGTATANASGVAVLRTLSLKSYASTLKLFVLRAGVSSGALAVSYPAETSTLTPPPAANITVNNAAGIANDTVTVSGVTAGDRIRVYTSNGATLLGEATATSSTVVVPVQLSAAAGSVRVSLVRGSTESTGTLKAYAAEPSTTPPPSAADITVVNAPGTANDTVTVLGVASGDIVRVYSADGTVELGERTSTGTSVVIYVALAAGGGTVGVSVERGGFQSTRTAVTYGAETVQKPNAPTAANIAVQNNAGTVNDSVTVTGVQSGDLVRVYEANGTTPIGQATASGTSVTIPVALNAAGGSVTATVERGGTASDRSVAVTYAADPTPAAPSAPAAGNITVTNAPGTTSDSVVVVDDVRSGDLVRVYAANGTTLLGQLLSTGTSVTIPVELNPAGGSIRVTIERGGIESALSVAVAYTAEPGAPTAPDAPAAGDVTVDNQTGTTNDTVTVSNVQNGDLVRVYAANGTTLLGQHTSTGTTAVVAVSLGAAAGNVRVSIERGGLQSALSAPVAYAAEPAAPTAPDAPAIADITVDNQTGTTNDTVTVLNVQTGDLVRVYAADGTTLLGQHTSTGTTAVVAVSLGAAAGDVRVSIERGGLESALSDPVGYVAEPAGPTAPDAPVSGDITVDNQPGTTNDTVTVLNVQTGDLVRVYATDGTTLLGQHTSTGTTAVVAVSLGAAAGDVRVSIERGGLESALSDPVSYVAEPAGPTAPDAPVSGDITVDNQPGTANDTVTVANVQNGDLVRVYASNQTTLLGQNTATGTTVSIPVELTANAGNVYVSITRAGLESLKTQATYSDEAVPAIDSASFDTTVYQGGSGTVVVSNVGILAGDTIILRVGGSEIARGSAIADGEVTITVASGQLLEAGGTFDAVLERSGIESTPPTSVTYAPVAAGTLQPPTVTQVTYNRDAGIVIVSGLQEGDIVNVTVDGGAPNASQPVATGETSASVPGFTFLPQGGTIRVTVSRGPDTSAPVTVVYDAIAPSAANAADISIVNNDGAATDFVTVENLTAGDRVIVYTADGSTVLGQATASGSTLAVPVILDPAGGSVQVVIVRYGLQSPPTTQTYGTETSGVTAPLPGDITVTNNAGNNDTVAVTGVQVGDIVTVYANNGTTILGKETVTTAGTITLEVTLDPGAGSVQVSITRGTAESGKTPQTYVAEPGGVTAPDENDITVANNPGNSDTVTVTGVQVGDIVTVYANNGTTILGKETVTTAGTITLEVTLDPGAGSVQVSITRGTAESGKTPQTYVAEPGGVTAPDANDITVANNPGNSDTVTVTGVQVGDIVTVYANNGTTILGKETVTTAGTITLDVTLDPGAGGVQVSITRGTAESGKTPKSYTAEGSTVTAPSADDITVTNNTGNADTVTVAGLQIGDIVTVYAADGIAVLGQATATAAGSLTLNVTLGAAAGNVRVAITRGNVQSAKTPKAYLAESNNVPAPALSDIQVVNNLGSQDTVTVTNVQVGDTVTVYAANGTTVLARVTATTAGTLTIPLTLPEGSGIVNVTITRGNVESQPASPNYTAEPTTLDAPAAASITVNNITGNSDNVTLTGLQAGDIITVYAANGTTILDRVTVGSDPATWVVPVTLNAAGGSVQVSITRGGIESGKTSVAYGAEPASVPAPVASDVTVNNNGATGSSVVVTNVQPGDIVTIYAANGTTIIGRAQVQPGATSIAIPVSLNEAGGSVQVTLTRGTTQSAPTLITYPARVEEQGPGTGGGTGGGTATPGGDGANPVTPATTPGGGNPVTPETLGEGEELEADGTGRVVPLVTAGNRTFADIQGHWAQDSIERLASLGILNGKNANTFDADSDVTRAEFTKMVSSLLGIASNADPAFDDVDTDDWHAPHVQGAYEQGIVQGYGDGTFQPNDTITRQEMTQILMNSMQWLQSDVFGSDPDYDSASAYNDYSSVGNWAQEPVARMLQEGLIIGKPGNRIDPGNNASRGEAATVIARLIDRMNNNFTIE